MSYFNQLYTAVKSRNSDLNEFLAHEVQSYPPSLTDFGRLPMDGTAYVRCLSTCSLRTFDDTYVYASGLGLPWKYTGHVRKPHGS